MHLAMKGLKVRARDLFSRELLAGMGFEEGVQVEEGGNWSG